MPHHMARVSQKIEPKRWAALRGNPREVARQIRQALNDGGSAEHATGVQGFFKEKIKSHGWYTAALRRAIRQCRREILHEHDFEFLTQVADQLFSGSVLEEKIAGVFLLEGLDAQCGDREFAGFESPDVPRALAELCSGLWSFAELKRAASGLIPLLEQKIGMRRLDEIAPARIRLQNGCQTKVHYERGKPPWIASRLQNFFGMFDTPRIGPERTPVVVHLLAPNQRSVQTTSDLGGFWERLYPQVRRQLMRRYPKHHWPERP